MKKFLFLWGLLLVVLGLPEKAHSQYLYRPTPYTYLFNTNSTAAEARAYLGVGTGGSFTNANLLNAIITDSSIVGGTNTGSTILGATITGSLTGTNAVLTTPAISGGTNSSGLFLNSTITGFTSSLQTNTDLTASRVLVSDSAKRITNSSVSTTTLGYLDATSSIQTQLNAKGAATNGTFSGGTFTGATNVSAVFTGVTNLVTSTNRFYFGDITTANNGSIRAATNGHLQLLGNTNIALDIASNGFVGLGTTNPAYRLDVWGDHIRVGGFYGVTFGGTDGVQNSTVNIVSPSTNILRLTSLTNQITGNLSVGMSVPPRDSQLAIYRAVSDTVGNESIGLAYNSSGSAGTVLWGWRMGTAYGLHLDRNYGGWAATPAMSVKIENGFVGIGATSPQYLLDVNGVARHIGTNGVSFGGTSGASDHTVTINQSSANTLALTATTTTVSGGLTIAGTTILTQSSPPASAAAAGTVGTIAWDANYIYVCTAANTWKRVAIATW